MLTQAGPCSQQWRDLTFLHRPVPPQQVAQPLPPARPRPRPGYLPPGRYSLRPGGRSECSPIRKPGTSAGNPYGHPNLAMLDLLRRERATVLRTDVDGDLATVADGRGLAVVRHGAPPGRR
jgi:hypothetical protein